MLQHACCRSVDAHSLHLAAGPHGLRRLVVALLRQCKVGEKAGKQPVNGASFWARSAAAAEQMRAAGGPRRHGQQTVLRYAVLRCVMLCCATTATLRDQWPALQTRPLTARKVDRWMRRPEALLHGTRAWSTAMRHALRFLGVRVVLLLVMRPGSSLAALTCAQGGGRASRGHVAC